MSNIVEFAVVLTVSMIGSSQAFTCYKCNYTRTPTSVSTGCGGTPTFRPSPQRECSASICNWQLSYPSATKNNITVRTDCVTDSAMTTSDPCARYRSNYTVFNYGEGCCYKTGNMPINGILYNMTTCFCQSDYCNGNISETVETLTTTPRPSGSTQTLTTRPRTTGSTQTLRTTPRPSGSTSNGMSLQKTSLWAMTVVAMTAMVAVIGG